MSKVKVYITAQGIVRWHGQVDGVYIANRSIDADFDAPEIQALRRNGWPLPKNSFVPSGARWLYNKCCLEHAAVSQRRIITGDKLQEVFAAFGADGIPSMFPDSKIRLEEDIAELGSDLQDLAIVFWYHAA